jgi:hypothetical protein
VIQLNTSRARNIVSAAMRAMAVVPTAIISRKLEVEERGKLLDILLCLKAEDSYGATHEQAHAGASEGSCFTEAGFTRVLRLEPEPSSSQANTRCPRARILIAPTTSALLLYPQATHSKCAWVRRFSGDTHVQTGQVRLVFCGGTTTRKPPLLLTVGLELILEGLAALHSANCIFPSD